MHSTFGETLARAQSAVERSHVGGVSAQHAEQWDYYECGAGCGTFEYRQRTRRLRKVS